MATDPLLHRAHADAILERAATGLRELLQTVARELDPFPEFPGAYFSYGIEVPLPPTIGGDIGCVVLAEDGDLYELQIGLDPEQIESRDPVAMRSEERVPLDLAPADYIACARRALEEALAVLEARGRAAGHA